MKNTLQDVSPTPAKLETLLNELTGEVPVLVDGKTLTISTRHTFSHEIQIAFRWLEQQYEQWGIATTRQSYEAPDDLTAENLIAEIPGAVNPDKIVIVGSHVDSRGLNAWDATERAPGADDNGTGTIAGLSVGLALHQLKQMGIRPAYTVRIAHFSGEEQTLLGSKAYAASLESEKLNIAGMFQLEMLGYSPKDERRLEMYDGGDMNGSRALVELITSTEKAHTLGLTLRHRNRPYPNRPSDHFPFWSLGVPAVCLSNDTIERPLNPRMHTKDDRVHHLNMPYFTQAAQLVIASICSAAQVALGSKE